MKKLFVTGATGFVGRHLITRLGAFENVVCLARDASKAPGAPANVEWVRGDLNDPASYAAHLRGADAVIHLAALTGKAKASEYERVNVAGTQALLDAAKNAGVPNFLHVSSVAVKFPNNQRSYAYGHSKERGEDLVRASGLRYAIVRPAIILGAGSPMWKGVAPMLKLPVMPVFGDGRTPIQPIHVADVAEFLLQILQRTRFDGETLEFGGPEVLSFEELLQRAREKRKGKRAPVLHVPLGPVVALLSVMEPLLFSVLPITTGQLSSFRYSGVMDANPLWEELRGRLRPVREMLE